MNALNRSVLSRWFAWQSPTAENYVYPPKYFRLIRSRIHSTMVQE